MEIEISTDVVIIKKKSHCDVFFGNELQTKKKV